MADQILNLGADAAQEPAFVNRSTDPVMTPAYALPADFVGQYPQPMDPTELLALCEEVSLLQQIPEQRTGLKAHLWREMTSLAYTSGSSYVSFADGACPEEFTHDGGNKTITLKNIGAKKNLGVSDIMHSAAVAGGYGDAISALLGPVGGSNGMPGSADTNTFVRKAVADLKAKEATLASTLVLNGWDRLLVQGDSNGNSLEFDGFEKFATNNSVTFHTNDNSASGAFSSTAFDRFLSESCAKPTHIFGHSTAIQEMLSGYMILGFQGSQVININDGNRVVPGFNFAAYVNTSVGRLACVADNNFRRNASGSTTFQADLWPMRMVHNGDPLVYRITQIPFSMTDLTPGCTMISFQIWAKTALVIKFACAQGKYTTQFTGRVTTTCTVLG
jgi:hypothetical protein